MKSRRLGAVMVVALVAIGCSGGSSQPDEVGASCQIGPGVVCRDQDLRSVSMVAANLRGADFSGADLRGSDLRDADLTDAKLVGALLGGVNFSDASLVNADLTRANFFFTNLTGANLAGANRTGVYACNVTQPNGTLVVGDCAVAAVPSGSIVPTTGTPPTGPPSVEYFRLEPPAQCLNDAAGTGIYVEWSTRNATALSFLVEGIRVVGANKARSRIRLPFVCDGRPHVVALQAFGPVQPLVARATFTASLDATEPVTADG